jgi:hypothetical protein
MSTLPSHPTDQPPPPVAQQLCGQAEVIIRPHDLDKRLPPVGSNPAVVLEAEAMFWRDLPELLKERPGQWVAYYSTARIGFGTTRAALWQECCRQGYMDFLVLHIEPYPDIDFI